MVRKQTHRKFHTAVQHLIHVCCVCVAKVKRGEVFQTPPGSFPCKAIFHVCGEKDAGVIEQLVCRIIQQCDSFRYKSVAIPAICAGKYCVRLSRKDPWGDKWPLLYHPATLYNILLINMIYLVIYELNYCSFASGVFVHFYMTKNLSSAGRPVKHMHSMPTNQCFLDKLLFWYSSVSNDPHVLMLTFHMYIDSCTLAFSLQFTWRAQRTLLHRIDTQFAKLVCESSQTSHTFSSTLPST